MVIVLSIKSILSQRSDSISPFLNPQKYKILNKILYISSSTQEIKLLNSLRFHIICLEIKLSLLTISLIVSKPLLSSILKLT